METRTPNNNTQREKLTGRLVIRLAPGTKEKLERVATRQDRPAAWLARKYIERALEDEQD